MKKIIQLNSYSISISELTGKTIYINESLNQFLIAPDLDLNAIIKVVDCWVERVGLLSSVHKPPPKVRFLVESLIDVTSREELAIKLEMIIGEEFRDKLGKSSIKNQQRFFVELMLLFWSYDIVAWPAKGQYPFSNFPLNLENIGLMGHKKSLLIKINSYLKRGSSDDSMNFRFIVDHLLSRIGILEIGDITPTTFYIIKERSKRGILRSTGLKSILILLRKEHYEKTQNWSPEVFGFFLKKMGKLAKDDNFNWLILKDPLMIEWVELAKYHLETTPTNFRKRKSSINNFLEHYVEHPELPRNPIKYFDIKNKPSAIYSLEGNQRRQEMNVIHQFLDQVLHRVCSQTDDNEIPVLMPGFANPLPIIKYKSVNKGETHREVMPTHLLSLAMKILVENDFAWAKKVGRITDTIRWLNPISNKYEAVWCPVRAYVLVIKLILPARTYQVRMVDSGEGDTYRYTDEGSWIKNIEKHAPKLSNTITENGIFRKYNRRDGSQGAIFFFNTNKTADINNVVNGYVMPWERKDALDIFIKMREWQEKYNPVNGATSWKDIVELKRTKHKDDLEKMGKNYFLFRDPATHYRPDLPVTDVRIRGLWLRLMDELESRLKENGQSLISGEPIKLILTREKSGGPKSSTFDLHTLRVTLITAMYESGIPPEYLAKIVGHATIIMTLYYTKIDTETVSLKIDEALLEWQKKSQIEMVGFIKKASRKELEQAVAFSSPTALDVISGSSSIGFLVMDHGICSVSAKRCHEGLENHDAASNVTKYQPIPGGAANCTRCRFFLTGPAFLFGLEAHVNNLIYRLKEVSFEYETTQSKFDILTDIYAEALSQKKPFHQQRELEKIETMMEALTLEVDEIALSIQSAYVLTEQCIYLINKTGGKEFSLVSAGKLNNLEAVFSEEHDFFQLNYICTKAIIYENLNIKWKFPNLERARMFDRMLRNSGIEPKFSLLNDVDLLLIANAMSQFLYTKFGANNVHDLIDGRTTLKALGIDQTFLEKFNEIKPKNLIDFKFIGNGE